MLASSPIRATDAAEPGASAKILTAVCGRTGYVPTLAQVLRVLGPCRIRCR